MRRPYLIIVIIIGSIFSPFANFIPGWSPARAQTPFSKRNANKLADGLRERMRAANSDSNETTRVILNLSDTADPQELGQALTQKGGRSQNNLDALRLMIADIPLNKLEELAARDDVAWISADQEVRSLLDSSSTSTTNNSHVEVTTGAGKILPVDQNGVFGIGVANGGAGNGVGIAVLDSGITPCDNAEFVGYKWQQSSGTLGTGLFSQTYIQSYNRITKAIDFTGENRTDDVYGHGTHAAGTGQSSVNYAADNPGSATYGGIATGATLVNVRVLNSQGLGTVSNVIAGINWIIKNKSTYNIRVMNLSLGTGITQSYKSEERR